MVVSNVTIHGGSHDVICLSL